MWIVIRQIRYRYKGNLKFFKQFGKIRLTIDKFKQADYNVILHYDNGKERIMHIMKKGRTTYGLLSLRFTSGRLVLSTTKDFSCGKQHRISFGCYNPNLQKIDESNLYNLPAWGNKKRAKRVKKFYETHGTIQEELAPYLEKR